MDYSAQMAALLGAVRKEMNGAVVDSLHYYGADYGRNYGVAIHTLRDMARGVGRNDALARFLYRQPVRELRIMALWITQPDRTSAADFSFWAEGIINSEVAEQAAHALLSQIGDVDALVAQWCVSGNALLAYAALLAASRAAQVSVPALMTGAGAAVRRFPDNRIVAQGVVSALASVVEMQRERVMLLLGEMGDSPTARFVREEMSWRITC